MSTSLSLALQKYMPLNSPPAALAIGLIHFPVILGYLSEKLNQNKNTTEANISGVQKQQKASPVLSDIFYSYQSICC